MALHVRLFGVPAVELDGVPVAVAVRPLCLVLLAMLLVAGNERRLSRRAIAADLWPDLDESAAAANLRRHLSFLSAALPDADDLVGRDREAIWWRASATTACDVVEFEGGMLERYAGDFMESFSHEWVLARRVHFRAVAVSGFLARAQELRDEDRGQEALAVTRRAVAVDPSDEVAVQCEIELLGEAGQLAAVDLAYALLRRRLHEIDASPSDATAELVERFHRLAAEATAGLPRPLTSYVGPEEIDRVAALLPASRLVTIVGTGGVGKTRLATEVALRVAPAYVDGARFVDLSALSETGALADAISRALGISNELTAKGFSGIATFLRNRRMLLVLDNCERLVESCAWFAGETLASAPHVTILATSREAFGLAAERRVPLAPIAADDATRLFFDRARSVGWNAAGVPEADARIATFCLKIDRLPLAIELAASLLGTLSLSDLEVELDSGLDRLRSVDPTASGRHRSLLEVIRSSVERLDVPSRAAFARLGVFEGPFSATAARAICGVDLATLGSLVAKSLLGRDHAVESRFVFLVSIASVSRRLLAEAPDACEVRNAHAAWYAEIAMRSYGSEFWRSEVAWVRDIDRDFSNISAGLRWSLFEGGLRECGFDLATGLSRYFLLRGNLTDGASSVRVAYDLAASGSRARARLARGLASIECWTGAFESAVDHAHEATSIFAEIGPENDYARSLSVEAGSLMYGGRADETDALLARALDGARRSGDRRLEGIVLTNLGFRASSTDRSLARERYAEALRIYNEIDAPGDAAFAHQALAGFDLLSSRYADATEHLERALAIHREIGGTHHISIATISDLGTVAFASGDVELARQRFAEAVELGSPGGHGLSLDSILGGCAAVAAATGKPRIAARLLGSAASSKMHGVATDARALVPRRARELVIEALGEDESAIEMRSGSELPIHAVIELAREAVASNRYEAAAETV